MIETDNLFDTTLSRPLNDLVDVNGRDMTRGDKIRRIEAEADSALDTLKDLCLTHEAWDTLKLVETEQAKRLRKQLPEWKTWAFWLALTGSIIAIAAWLFPKA
jgi:hypothetical protein